MSNQLINIVVSTFDLTKTDSEILKALIQQKGGLLISQITKKIQRSECTVRERIKQLHKHGFHHRDIEILENKRLAYRYNIKSDQTLISKVKYHLLKKNRELNDLI